MRIDRATSMWARLARRAVRGRSDLLLGLLDAVLLTAALAFVLLLRFDGAVPRRFWEEFLTFLPMAIVIALLSNKVFGLYGQIWRHASMQEAQRLLLAGITDLSALLVLEELTHRRAPLSVTVLGTGVAIFLMALVRFQSRLFSFRRRTGATDGFRVVVIGARDAAAALAREMLRSPRAGYHPVAIVDPDPSLHGRIVMGLRVEGGIADLPRVATAFDASVAVVGMSSVDASTMRVVAAAAEEAGVALKVVPDLAAQLSDGISLHNLRDVAIEDLIGRKEIRSDLEAVRSMLAGRRVLITGAGGSIGSEIARQVATFEPSELVLLDHDESHLHDLAISMTEPTVLVLADIRNRLRVLDIFERHRPEVVFHAAAHKHVPLLESHPCEAAATNVLGTDNLLEGAVAVGVGRFVFISTDKAVAPSSVMGASKRLGEQLVLARAPRHVRYCAVRFGNVLGSRGSVVPTFMRQIAAGGPVTVTDPRMTRYFMSIEESVQLVLQAAALAEGRDLFVLDMGEQVRIIDLAERMIRLSGRRVGDIEIQITGARPGEKLYEELLTPQETMLSTNHPAVSRVEPKVLPVDRLDHAVVELDRLTAEFDASRVRDELFAVVSAIDELPDDAAPTLVPVQPE